MKNAVISEKEIRHDETNLKIEKSSSKESDRKEEKVKAQKPEYNCRFCGRQGHKVTNCRYKRRKEKAKRLKEQVQKQKSEENFKTFIKEQLFNIANEIKQALTPVLKLDETMKKLNHFEEKMKDMQEQLQNALKNNKVQHQEQMKVDQPTINQIFAPIKEELKPLPKEEIKQGSNLTLAPKELPQHHENERYTHDDDEYAWEYEIAQAQQDAEQSNHMKQHYEEENAWIQDEHIQQPTHDDEYTWERELKDPTLIHQQYEEEDAWTSNEESTGFGEQATYTRAQGDNQKLKIERSRTHNNSHRKNRKTLRSTHNLANREANPTYWYIYEPEENQDSLMLKKAWIITSKEEYNFCARKLWINKDREEREFTYIHAEDFKPLNEDEKKRAFLEINFLNKKLKK